MENAVQCSWFRISQLHPSHQGCTWALQGLCSAAQAYSGGTPPGSRCAALSWLELSSPDKQSRGTVPDFSRHYCAPGFIFRMVSHRNKKAAVLPLGIGLLLVPSKPRGQVCISQSGKFSKLCKLLQVS